MTPLDERKVAAFHDKIYDLACRTFGVDQDGDCAVSVKVIDRTGNEDGHWFPVPYEHKAKTPDEKATVEAALLDSLAQAVDALSRYRGLQRHFERVAAAVGWTRAEMVSLAESGDRMPNLNRIPRLAKGLVLDPAALCKFALAETLSGALQDAVGDAAPATPGIPGKINLRIPVNRSFDRQYYSENERGEIGQTWPPPRNLTSES